MLCNRRIFFAGLAALCTGCGFAPVYQSGSTAHTLRGQVTIQEPADRLEYEFVKGLQRQLGRTGQGRYDLRFDLDISTRSTVVSTDQEQDRFAVDGSISVTLLDNRDGSVLSRSIRSFTSYSATGSTLATDRARRDAETRLAVILADRVVNELITALPN